jgi:ferredoxin
MVQPKSVKTGRLTPRQVLLAAGIVALAGLLYLRCPEVPRIRELAREFGVMEEPWVKRLKPRNEDCMLCGLCTRICKERMKVSAIGFVGRGPNRKVSAPFGRPSPVCVTCGACESVCPLGTLKLGKITENVPRPLLSDYDAGLAQRGSIYIPFAQAIPKVPVIDRNTCQFFGRGVCRTCEAFCEAKAINYEQEDKLADIDVGSVILCPGFDTFDPSSIREYGYGRYPNVVTSLQFERILSARRELRDGRRFQPQFTGTYRQPAVARCCASKSNEKDP